MAAVRHYDTEPEMQVRRVLRTLSLRFRGHVKALPGRPDIVVSSRRLVLQVNGCFWHGHRCRRGTPPATNRAFWRAKVTRNRARDARCARSLRREGWRVFTLWECRLMKWSEAQLRGYVEQAVALRRR